MDQINLYKLRRAIFVYFFQNNCKETSLKLCNFWMKDQFGRAWIHPNPDFFGPLIIIGTSYGVVWFFKEALLEKGKINSKPFRNDEKIQVKGPTDFRDTF